MKEITSKLFHQLVSELSKKGRTAACLAKAHVELRITTAILGRKHGQASAKPTRNYLPITSCLGLRRAPNTKDLLQKKDESFLR